MKNLTMYVILTLAAALSGCGSMVVQPPEDDGGLGDAPWTSDAPAPTDRPPAIDVPPQVDVPLACTSGADCPRGMACLGGEGCAVPWTCQPAVARPCTADYAPFCGCDGTTFRGSSSCPDRPFAHRGECATPVDGGPAGCALPDGSICGLGETCRTGACSVCACSTTGALRCTGACVDAGPPRTCNSTADCPGGTMCMGPDGCGVPWTCQAPPPCTRDVALFCACDGTTFRASSTCPGRPFAYRGACGIVPPPVDAGPAGCALPDGRVCRVGETCRIGECATCFCAASGELRCTMVACVDAGTPRTCASNGDCPAGTECAGAEGCGTRWTCQPARGCTADLAAFCACDGTTFRASSTCPGRPYAHRGACGIVPPPVDAGPGTCVIDGVTCPVGVPCRINECTVCRCDGDSVGCGVVPGCVLDGGVDAGAPPPLCPAQDARGVGFCDGFFGYAWNGSGCVGISGCSCAGADCRGLPFDRTVCENSHRLCPRPL
jgi:hypothetical protein